MTCDNCGHDHPTIGVAKIAAYPVDRPPLEELGEVREEKLDGVGDKIQLYVEVDTSDGALDIVVTGGPSAHLEVPPIVTVVSLLQRLGAQLAGAIDVMPGAESVEDFLKEQEQGE